MAEKPGALKAVSGRLTSTKGKSELLYGKVPPQAIPLEEVVLGAIMIDKDGFPSIIEILRPESFYLEKN